ncbi:MAG TPA: TetR/AcrR family transcriptional regulator [Acidimicrobiia bacterium]|jgi:AcrR family transcriptional regulator|nr:TetR/AcrR family transcriptional regulator [Acidimicrobiia bacterium]
MRLPADERRQQLLEVACDLFARSGFHDTSMDDIAEGAGVTKPVLYQHFPSKKALYGELLEDTGRRLLDHLARATSAATSGRERVEAGFRAYFQFAVGDRSSFRLLFGASIRSDPDFARTVDEVLRAAADTISELIAIPASAEQRRVLASALVGMAEAVGRRALGEPDVDGDELARWIAEFAWFGLRGVRADEGVRRS